MRWQSWDKVVDDILGRNDYLSSYAPKCATFVFHVLLWPAPPSNLTWTPITCAPVMPEAEAEAANS
jgi:hypothetical protein